MAVSYRASVKGACWKQHTCVLCGAEYRYRFERSVQSTGNSPAAAQQGAQKQLQTALETQVDSRPCPQCGLIQPEMIGQKRESEHGCMIGLSFLLMFVLWICYAAEWAHYRTLIYIGLAATCFIAWRHISQSIRNPNHNLEKNKTQAAAEVQSGIAQLIQPGKSAEIDSVPTAISGSMKAAFLFLLGALLAFPAAEVVRVAAGWKYNANCDPPVIGPGDTVRCHTGDTLDSIKGYWKAHSSITCANEAELGLPKSSQEFTLRDHQESWNDPINAKSSEEHTSSNLYVDITVPNASELAGKTAALDLIMDTLSPHANASTFTDQTNHFTRRLELAISPPGSGARYLQIWWTGMGAGLFLQIIAGFMLSSNAKKLKAGLPTRLIPIS